MLIQHSVSGRCDGCCKKFDGAHLILHRVAIDYTYIQVCVCSDACIVTARNRLMAMHYNAQLHMLVCSPPCLHPCHAGEQYANQRSAVSS